MKRFLWLCVALSLGVMLSCQRGASAGAGTAGPAPHPGTIVIRELSNPDEAVQSLMKVYAADVWKGQIDTSDAIAASDNEVIALQVGARSANAALEAVLGEFDQAEKIAAAVKNGAAKLNITSPTLEATAAALKDDLKIADEAKKKAAVRNRVNMLRTQVDQLIQGKGSQSALIELGAWIEGIRIVSGAINTKYVATASGALNRADEAAYFKSQLAILDSEASTPRLKLLIAGVQAIMDAMTPAADRSIAKSAVQTIHSKAAELAAQYK